VSSTEAELLNRAIKGDSEAFASLVELYQTPVYHLCYRMMGDSGEAEDAAQETFLRAYQNMKRYDRQRSFITWLLSIAAHYCIDQIRRRRAPIVPLDVLPDEAVPDAMPGPEGLSTTRDSQNRMRALLASLNPQDRAAIILRYWYDLSEEEIAGSLSLTVSAVKSRLHRARRDLAQLWQQQTEPQTFERRPYEPSAL
jgi:RNA polymerase sigma-70 factor (ECF subfamily)